jgi:bifunctional DNase/RNase
VHGVFHAELVCFDGTREHRIDARTSDAVALSLRFHCPIYTYENIMSAAGMVIDEKKDLETEIEDKHKSAKRSTGNIFEQHSDEELKELLQKSIENEEYEKASRIRDEINRRKEK